MPGTPLSPLQIQVKALQFMADRFAEISAALAQPPERTTHGVFIEQVNWMKMMLDYTFDEHDKARPAFGYKKFYDWSFGEFAADFDTYFNPRKPVVSLFERDWPVTVAQDAADRPVARMAVWVERLRVMPQSFTLPLDHFASECALAEFVFDEAAENADEDLTSFAVAKLYANQNIVWFSRIEPVVEKFEDSPVKTILLLYARFAANWNKVFEKYAQMLTEQ